MYLLQAFGIVWLSRQVSDDQQRQCNITQTTHRSSSNWPIRSQYYTKWPIRARLTVHVNHNYVNWRSFTDEQATHLCLEMMTEGAAWANLLERQVSWTNVSSDSWKWEELKIWLCEKIRSWSFSCLECATWPCWLSTWLVSDPPWKWKCPWVEVVLLKSNGIKTKPKSHYQTIFAFLWSPMTFYWHYECFSWIQSYFRLICAH